jgi:hypothetical protein
MKFVENKEVREKGLEDFWKWNKTKEAKEF